MTDNNVVKLRQMTLPEKANPQIPDEVWGRIQNLGVKAVGHLEAIMDDPRFPMLSIKEKMRVIETALVRAYGAPDGSIRRHMHIHGQVDHLDAGSNAMTGLANKAKRSLPEFKNSRLPDADAVEDAIVDDAADSVPSKYVPGDRD